VKERLMEMLNQDKEFSEEDTEKVSYLFIHLQ